MNGAILKRNHWKLDWARWAIHSTVWLGVLGGVVVISKIGHVNANRKERVLSLSEYQIAVSHKFYGSQPDARICCLPCERLNRGCFNLKTQVSFL